MFDLRRDDRHVGAYADGPGRICLPGLTVMGVAADGTETPLTDYRWLVEEDLTYHVPVDGDGAPSRTRNTLSVSFHRSYMPVVAKGCVGFDDLDPLGRPATSSPLSTGEPLLRLGGPALRLQHRWRCL